MTRTLAVVAALAALGACGQHEGGVEWGPPPESIAVVPSDDHIGVNEQAALVATFVPGGSDTRVSWTATGGTVVPGTAATAAFTAPGFSGTFTITATSIAEPAVSGSANIVVTGGITVSIPPQGVTACVTTQLRADAAGTTTPTVTWTAPDPSCGIVTPAGAFTSSRGSGGCPVVACSTVDPGACGEGLVNVLPERILQVNVSPASTNLAINGTQVFSATVKTSCGDFAAGG